MRLADRLMREPTVYLVAKLWAMSQGRRHLIALFAGMFTLSNVLLLLPPAIFGALVREVQAHGASAANLPHILAYMALLFGNLLVFWTFHGPARVIERSVAQAAEVRYREVLLGRALARDLTWHAVHESGDTIDRINRASEGLFLFGQNLFQVIGVVVRLIGTTTALLFFSPSVGGLALALVVVSCLAIQRFDRRLMGEQQRLNLLSNRAAARLFDVLANVTTAKILALEAPLLESTQARYRAAMPLFRANARLHEQKWFVGGVGFQLVAVVPLATYVLVRVRAGQSVDAGDLSACYVYLNNLTHIYTTFGSLYQELSLARQRVVNAGAIEEEVERRGRIPRAALPPWQRLALRGVAFDYQPAVTHTGLREVALGLRRGERVALVGESGAGKSTFLKVLHGMYAGARGEVAVDDDWGNGRPLVATDLESMLVPQEPEVFSASMRENITLGLDLAESEVRRAVHLSTLDKLLADLAGGLEAPVSERGANLSGGQKQRLALARALLFARNKRLLLLDESTSSVDPTNEAQIYANIWAAFADTTIVASVHRLNLLAAFDTIVFFARGRIVEHGTFTDLLASRGAFSQAWERFSHARGRSAEPPAESRDEV